jgi:IgA peptidase M64
MTSGGTAGDAIPGEAIPVVNNGDPRRRWNLVVLGDGYRADQLADFHRDVNGFAETLQATPPFDEMWSAINVYRIDVTSPDSGADDPTDCGGTGANPTTYFNATFCSRWGTQRLDRLLTVDSRKAKSIAKNRLPQTHQVLVIVNSRKYGGSGGRVAVCSMAPEAFSVAIHEIGHSAFHLADEYDEPDLVAPTGEPMQANITISAIRANRKWGDLIRASTPVPSSRNPRCGSFPAITAVSARAVGAFEGAGHSGCGVFRPAASCRMRTLNDRFCPVCERAIRRTLAVFRGSKPITGTVMAELEFDPIATQIGNQEVVSFLCYVSEPLSEAGRYCLVTDPWFDDWVLVDRADVVASIAGTTRADGKSVVWVRRQALVEKKDGSTTSAGDAAVAVGVEEAETVSGISSPPPVKHPR